MRKNKLDNYSLTASIHTLAVKSQGIVENVMGEVSKCIKSRSQTKDGYTTTSIINPNKLVGDVFCYSEFETVLDTILCGANINEYEITRADLRLDSYDGNHYKEYSKLNKYLIIALAVTYKVKNGYQTNGLIILDRLSVAIKNKYFEAENYNKEVESGGADIAKSRLEFRSKSGFKNDLKKEFVDGWFRRLDKAVKNLSVVQEKCNDELVRKYFEDKNAYPRKFMNVKEFLMQYQDNIFSKSQMIDLLSRLGDCKNPKKYAEYYKKRYGIEYFSQKDVDKVVKEIKRAILEFFNN